MKKRDLQTEIIHRKPTDVMEGYPEYYPIYQTATYYYQSATEISEAFSGKKHGSVYSRISNPTVLEFEKIINNMDCGIGAIATVSGMSAISLTTLSLIEKRKKVLSQRGIFGGTYSLFVKTLSNLGIRTEFLETEKVEEVADRIDEETAFVFLETIGNPMLNVLEIDKISSICSEKKVPLVLDNTMLPYLFSPREYNVSLSLYSTTKFISGMSTSTGGALIDLENFNWNNDNYPEIKELFSRFKKFAFLAKARKVLRDLGFIQTPFHAYLQIIGFETLPLRMKRQCKNAYKLATFLSTHKKIVSVNYPGLSTSPYYNTAKRLFKTYFGSILTFELRNKEEAFKFIDSLKWAKILANIGDIRTVVIHPASTIFYEFNNEERKNNGVNDGLIRVSVGIENISLIIKDFKEALDKLWN